eukprot:988897_1
MSLALTMHSERTCPKGSCGVWDLGMDVSLNMLGFSNNGFFARFEVWIWTPGQRWGLDLPALGSAAAAAAAAEVVPVEVPPIAAKSSTVANNDDSSASATAAAAAAAAAA